MAVGRNSLSVLAGALFIIGCGTDAPVKNVGPDPEPWSNQKPIVQIASPGSMAVGDLLTVLGQNFVDPPHGKVYLQFKGTFFDSEGSANPVDLQATPTVNLSTDRKVVKSLSWEMWPNIVFHQNGDQLGRFVGHVVAMNAGNDGSQEVSDPLPITIDVEPSIIPRLSQPVGSQCAPVVKNTLENQPMAFIGEVVGLRAATADAPLTFRWTFRSEDWKLGFANSPTVDPSMWTRVNPFFDLDPGGVVRPKSGAIVLEQTVTDGQTSRIGTSWNSSVLVKAVSTAGGDEPLGLTRLTELTTGSITTPGGSSTVTVNVEVSDATGKSARLSLRLTLRQIAELVYDGGSRIAEYFEPKPVSGCSPGGDIGSDLSYSESESERRDRSVSFNWNSSYNVGFSIGYWGGFNMGLNASLNYGFGVNIAESISSDKSISKSLSKHVLPGNYGMLMRQTVKLYRIGQMVANTECGQAVPLGDAVLTDWTWSPEIATGPTCPPRSNLPPAQKFE